MFYVGEMIHLSIILKQALHVNNSGVLLKLLSLWYLFKCFSFIMVVCQANLKISLFDAVDSVVLKWGKLRVSEISSLKN